MNYTDLPPNYFVSSENGKRRILKEMEPVWRIVATGQPEVKESDEREVAGFPKETPQKEVREIARLDHASRNMALPQAERASALSLLAERFRQCRR